MAYRLIGLAARMCMEMGLHRRDALVKSFPNEDQWNDITRVFWTVYSLDRRWSLGTGLPFIIQDEDIDPNLPEPVSTIIPISVKLSFPNFDQSLGFVFTLSPVHDLVQSDQLEDLVLWPWFRGDN